MPPRLPNELVDQIISSIVSRPWLPHGERQALLNCTLVCHDWLPASRQALFYHVQLTRPAAWDSFRRWVVDAEEGRPWLLSIHHFTFIDRHYGYEIGGKGVVVKLFPFEWRGQYVIPVLAGHLPHLESLFLTVDWARCAPHPTTFGLFAQFASLRRVNFSHCQFPSFSTFRRVLASLPALKHLLCDSVHWPSAPQPSVLVVSSRYPALETLSVFSACRGCTLALLEWLTHTPARAALTGLTLHPGFLESLESSRPPHRISLPHIDYYAQIFAPSLRRALLFQTERTTDIASRISLSGFGKLQFLTLDVDGTDWSDIADMLRSLPSRLLTLSIDILYPQPLRDDDWLVEEDGECKAMRTNSLELLDPVLARDNFKDLNLLSFELKGYDDTLPAYHERTLAAIHQKLPAAYGRKSLKIELHLCSFNRPPPVPPLAESGESAQSTA